MWDVQTAKPQRLRTGNDRFDYNVEVNPAQTKYRLPQVSADRTASGQEEKEASNHELALLSPRRSKERIQNGKTKERP